MGVALQIVTGCSSVARVRTSMPALMWEGWGCRAAAWWLEYEKVQDADSMSAMLGDLIAPLILVGPVARKIAHLAASHFRRAATSSQGVKEGGLRLESTD